MYRSFYALKQDPFGPGFSPSLVFTHEHYANARNHIENDLMRDQGLSIVIGATGTGKSTVMEDVLSRYPLGDLRTIRLDAGKLTNSKLIPEIAHAITGTGPLLDPTSALAAIKKYIASQQRQRKKVLLMLDDAHEYTEQAISAIDALVLDQENTDQAIQFFLLGEPSLRNSIFQEGEQLHRLGQSVCELVSMDASETAGYVQHRLSVAGARNDLFTPGSISEIHELADGNPAEVNQLCRQLLQWGAKHKKQLLDVEDLANALDIPELNTPKSTKDVDIEVTAGTTNAFTDDLQTSSAPEIYGNSSLGMNTFAKSRDSTGNTVRPISQSVTEGSGAFLTKFSEPPPSQDDPVAAGPQQQSTEQVSQDEFPNGDMQQGLTALGPEDKAAATDLQDDLILSATDPQEEQQSAKPRRLGLVVVLIAMVTGAIWFAWEAGLLNDLPAQWQSLTELPLAQQTQDAASSQIETDLNDVEKDSGNQPEVVNSDTLSPVSDFQPQPSEASSVDTTQTETVQLDDTEQTPLLGDETAFLPDPDFSAPDSTIPRDETPPSLDNTLLPESSPEDAIEDYIGLPADGSDALQLEADIVTDEEAELAQGPDEEEALAQFRSPAESTQDAANGRTPEDQIEAETPDPNDPFRYIDSGVTLIGDSPVISNDLEAALSPSLAYSERLSDGTITAVPEGLTPISRMQTRAEVEQNIERIIYTLRNFQGVDVVVLTQQVNEVGNVREREQVARMIDAVMTQFAQGRLGDTEIRREEVNFINALGNGSSPAMQLKFVPK